MGVAVELHEFPAEGDGGFLIRHRNADFTTHFTAAFAAVFTATDVHIIRSRCAHRGPVTALSQAIDVDQGVGRVGVRVRRRIEPLIARPLPPGQLRGGWRRAHDHLVSLPFDALRAGS